VDPDLARALDCVRRTAEEYAKNDIYLSVKTAEDVVCNLMHDQRLPDPSPEIISLLASELIKISSEYWE
jgi:hypothetical protein